ncbi:MAG: BCCT family transporter, partial [Bowdeniella nasicola]|nr:BCCT family transporter [Bowdeniella nasicola]
MSTTAPTKKIPKTTDPVVTYISLAAIAIFVVAALAIPEKVSNFVNAGFSWSAGWFGLYWQILLLATFLVSLILMCLPWAKVYLGDTRIPEFSAFKWIAMIMCTLLAGGGVFWAAAEPVYHYLNAPPPLAGYITSEADRPVAALAQSFVHWGFLAWAILGTTGAVILSRAHEKGLPLRPRSLLYPLGENIVQSWIGKVADIVAIIAVVAGTVGPIGFLGLQVAYGLHDYLGWTNNYPLQLGVIIVLVALAAISVASGLDKGIQILSRLNVWIAIILMVIVLLLTSVVTTVEWFGKAVFLHVQTFFATTLYTGDPGWSSGWTIFFFGWFLGYGPLMAIFVARISTGRTIRQLFFTVAIVAPVLTMFWFTVLGGSAVGFEHTNPGSISEPLGVGGLPAAIMAMTSQLPFGAIIGGAFLILTVTFVSTTADSMSYSIAQSCTTEGQPPRWLRALWAIFMGGAAAVLLSIGDGGISALQSWICLTAGAGGWVWLPA